MHDAKPLRSFFFDRRLLSTFEHISDTVGTGGGGMSISVDDSAITGSRAGGTKVFVVAAVEVAINYDWRLRYGLCTSSLLLTTSLGCFFLGERPDDDKFAAVFLVSASDIISIS